MRRMIAFACAGETLFGTLDEGAGQSGLLIISGGNEIRSGSHRGMARLAQQTAAELGVPVFRYDRRGVGDSTGANQGFEHSAQDIAAAAATFAAEVPGMRRIVAFGNCDAATALALFHGAAGIDALLIANPWTIEQSAASDLPHAAAIRARYAERLKDPREWLRLLRGGVNIGKVLKGIGKVIGSRTGPAAAASPDSLAARLGAALGSAQVPVTLLIARRDNTAIAFMDAWKGEAFAAARTAITPVERDTASHSFAGPGDEAWLFDRVKDALGG
ncbi:hydrolase 1, exosortase A system-associated [Sphingomonas canadensis]|uniref:Hydrolase 1, exosortase A system-associated n=1 Tax=Sphingomonas canadensis TaxID=1219257 RepID=A0ABW3H489_9SPHN|nr:hydrolase 1, exosortase A system-associated [Sphingomonas canadensis]MCW3835556.1 hydrolase 1, exosortase A system-associated [Sphingomonas canadensis]